MFKQRYHLWQSSCNRGHWGVVFAVVSYPSRFIWLLMGNTGGFNTVYRSLMLAWISAPSPGYGMVFICFLCEWEGDTFRDFQLTFTYDSSYPRDHKTSVEFRHFIEYIHLNCIFSNQKNDHQGLFRSIEYILNQTWSQT